MASICKLYRLPERYHTFYAISRLAQQLDIFEHEHDYD